MPHPASRLTRPYNPAGLYLMPSRTTPRPRHIPAGRTLHIVDIENLVGGHLECVGPVAAMVEAYRRVAPVNPGDLVLVGAGRRLALSAGSAWPGAQLIVGRGIDGADLALIARLENTSWIASRFDRLIVGSGDHIFAETLAAFRRLGVATGVVAPVGRIAATLYRQADFVRTICEPGSEMEAA